MFLYHFASYLYRNVAFISASVVGVLVALSVYDEDVLTVEHVLSIITVCGCVLAGARCVCSVRAYTRGLQRDLNATL